MNNYPYRPQQQGYSMMSQPSQQMMTPMYPGPFQPLTQPPTQPISNIRWVQGRAGANAFNVSPGETAQLMDTEDSVFYIKTADYSGMPLPLRTFDYSERFQVDEKDDKVSRSEFEALKTRFDSQSEKLADLLGGEQ
jgi:hypothetical protein